MHCLCIINFQFIDRCPVAVQCTLSVHSDASRPNTVYTFSAGTVKLQCIRNNYIVCLPKWVYLQYTLQVNELGHYVYNVHSQRSYTATSGACMDFWKCTLCGSAIWRCAYGMHFVTQLRCIFYCHCALCKLTMYRKHIFQKRSESWLDISQRHVVFLKIIKYSYYYYLS